MVASPELRKSELTNTAPVCSHLQAFIFGEKMEGMVVHQAPIKKDRKRPGNPLAADLAICDIQKNGTPVEPILVSDTKLGSLVDASQTTAKYAVGAVETAHDDTTWPVLLGLPITPPTAVIQVFIAVRFNLWRISVFTGNLYHTLCVGSLSQAKPNSNSNTIDPPLPRYKRVPKSQQQGFYSESENLVHKYFDVDASDILPEQRVLELMNAIFKQLKFTDLTGTNRVYCLQYDYIEGDHIPMTLASFSGAVKILFLLHKEKIVHGDIRLSNILFFKNTSILIDFDLSRTEYCKYPANYRSQATFPERHVGAFGHSSMLLEHDRHAHYDL